MEFPSDILQGLTYLGNTSYISDENFKRIVNSCFGLLAGETQIERVSSICPEKGEVVQTAYSSLLSLIIESIRSETADDYLRNFLEKRSIQRERSDYIVKVHNNYKDIILRSLQNCHSSFPSLVDVHWRLDFVVKSNMQDSVGEQLYYIVITTKNEDKLDYVRFTCNIHQLQELSSKFKEIVCHLEKLSYI